SELHTASCPSPSRDRRPSLAPHARRGAFLPSSAKSNPHRHQHVKGTRVGAVAHDCRRTSIRHDELRALAVDLLGDVQKVSGIKTDLERARGIAHLELLDGGAVFG